MGGSGGVPKGTPVPNHKGLLSLSIKRSKEGGKQCADSLQVVTEWGPLMVTLRVCSRPLLTLGLHTNKLKSPKHKRCWLSQDTIKQANLTKVKNKTVMSPLTARGTLHYLIIVNKAPTPKYAYPLHLCKINPLGNILGQVRRSVNIQLFQAG